MIQQHVPKEEKFDEFEEKRIEYLKEQNKK
jgi:hypothetical protein